MKKTSRSVDSTQQSRVSWGKLYRTRHFQAEEPSVSPPELEHVIINKAPLPSPTLLEDYDRALPGAADRIVKLLEQHVIHQQEIEKKKFDAEAARANKRDSFTYVTRLLAVAGGFILLWYGKNPAGAIAFTAFILTFAELLKPSVVRTLRQAKIHQKQIPTGNECIGLRNEPGGLRFEAGQIGYNRGDAV